MCGAEFFRQRPNFLIDGAEKFVQELATLSTLRTTSADFLQITDKYFKYNKYHSYKNPHMDHLFIVVGQCYKTEPEPHIFGVTRSQARKL
jgi:hypothetical protein